jgi:adenine/guanine phosphoribosyltransferase-like PRPP-binding protein
LLVALGSISTVDKAGAVVAGVAVLALMGELLRRVRLERSTPSEKLAPKDSVARWRLRLS